MAEKLHHDDVARDLEQQVQGATYCESEGATTTRVDFGHESIWLSSFPQYGKVKITGTITNTLHNRLTRYLIKTYGAKQLDLSDVMSYK